MALTSILVARLLGPENYGLYTVALIAPSFLIAFSDLGISPALTRFSASLRSEGKGQKAAALIKAGITFKLALSLILAVTLFLLSETIAIHILKRPGIGPLVRFTALYLVGQAVLVTVDSTFIGLDKMENSSFLMNIQAVTKAGASILLIILGLGAIGATLGLGLGFLLAAGIGITLLFLRTYPTLYRHGHSENIGFFQGLKLMVSYGIPLYLSSLMFSLLVQYRSLILALFVSNTEIGNYTTAMNFSVLITLLTYPIAASLFPAFSKLSIEKYRSSVEKMFRLSVKYTSLLVIPASLALAVLSKDIVYALYGPMYQLAPGYLAVYAMTFLCTGLGMLVISSFFNGQGDTRVTLSINLINLTVSAPLAVILTLLYGVPGLLASIVTSQLLSTVYGLSLARRKYMVSLDWFSSLRTGIASLFPAMLVYVFLRFAPLSTPIHRLVAGGSLYLISFLVFAPLLGAISKTDIRNLNELLRVLAPIYPIARLILKVEDKILALK